MDELKKQLDVWYRKRFASESFVPSLNYLFDMLVEQGIDSLSRLEEHIESGEIENTIKSYYKKMREVSKKQRKHAYVEVDSEE